MQLKHFLASLFILVLIGFFPFSCCKPAPPQNIKLDIKKITGIHHFTNLSNFTDSISSQVDFDTIKNSDSLFIFVTFELKEITMNHFNFSLTNTSFACEPLPNTSILGNKITEIELSSDTTYNGNLKNTNLLSIITENGSSLKDLMNTTTDFTKNIYFKLNTKPTDVLTHQFTVKFTKENGDVILAKSKKLTWLN
ncbi:MAG: hypothetical protein IPL21_10130 [Saprospirales bacterium]|nr:hypothetical protein [Saprospirales bacterium]